MLLSEKWVRGFFVVVLAGVLSACGDESPPVVPPEASLTIEAAKTLRFDWSDVADATAYRLLENPDGMSGFTPVGESVESGAETLALTVPLYARVNAQYILQACNSAGCADSDTLSVSGNLASGIGYFKASNTEAGDSFGSAVSLSADGNTLAVGATGEDSNATLEDGVQGNNSASNAGAVYVFAREAGGWSQQAYLKASNAEAGDMFGIAVSLSADGHTLAVGANFEDSDAEGGDDTDTQGNNSANEAGAVYVFEREAGAWSQQAYLKASNTSAYDQFGRAVSLSADGQTLAVGAYGESSAATGVNGAQSDNSADYAGAVYVFTREADVWSQQAYLKASNTSANDQFGTAVSLSVDGDKLAVGAPGEGGAEKGVKGAQNGNSAAFSGAVYVFAREADVWSQQAYLKASNADPHDKFGETVSLSADGQTLAVGATGEKSAVTGVNGDQGNNSASNAGAVYVFTREAEAWSQQAYLKASNTGILHLFGEAVSLSENGDTLAVGAYGEGSAAKGVNGLEIDKSASFAGAVYVFTREAGIWSQQAYLKASNTGGGDELGSAVSLSADGRTLAVGATEEDGAETGVNGSQGDNSAIGAGAVYLY